MRIGKHNKTSGRTALEWKSARNPLLEPEQELIIAQGLLSGGVDLDKDPADLEDFMLTDCLNFWCRRTKTIRRYGTVDYGPTEPNSSPVLGYNTMRRFSGAIEMHRFATTSIHKQNPSSWTAVTGAALGGATTDRFTVIAAADRLFFTNNGVLALQEINLGANTYAIAGNVVRYKYYTAIGTRIVGANLAGPSANPIQIGWCKDGDYVEWSNAVHVTAGSVNLIDTGGGYGDEITGIFNLEGALIVLRRKSIWAGIPQPSGETPFNWQLLSAGIGCSVPYSACIGVGKLFWYDEVTSAFYSYSREEGIKNIDHSKDTHRVGRTVRMQIENPGLCFCGYDYVDDEYVFGIRYTSSATVKLWRYNVESDAWVYEERVNTTGFWPSLVEQGVVVINALVGKIDDLIGKINDLSPSTISVVNVYGHSNGVLLKEDYTTYTDDGVSYTSRVRSKTIINGIEDMAINELRIGYIPKQTGVLTASYSIDGGVNWVQYYNTVSLSGADVNKRMVARFMKHIRCRNFSWQLIATGGVELIEYAVRGFSAGISYD